MDNRINDMVAPGCSHWAPLPVAEAHPVLPSLQTLSGVRNTSLNMHRLPVPARASTAPLYLTPPPPGMQVREDIFAGQLRQLVSGMDKCPSASVLAQITGVGESRIRNILGAAYASFLGPLSPSEDSYRSGSLKPKILLRTEASEADGRAQSLRQALPREENEANGDYARRLVLFHEDIEAISAVSGLSLAHIRQLKRVAVAERDGRAERLCRAYPQHCDEKHGDYTRRLLTRSTDAEAISAVTGLTLSAIHRLIRTVREEHDGREAMLRQLHPRRLHESNGSYAHRLKRLRSHLEAISAVSGVELAKTQELRRRAMNTMSDTH